MHPFRAGLGGQPEGGGTLRRQSGGAGPPQEGQWVGSWLLQGLLSLLLGQDLLVQDHLDVILKRSMRNNKQEK